MAGSTLRRLAPSSAAWVRQPVWADTMSPAEHAGWREETTVATASPAMTAPREIGGAYDSRSSIRPRIYGSRDSQHSFAGTASARELGIPLSPSGESCIPLSSDCQIFPYFLYGVERFCHSGDNLGSLPRLPDRRRSHPRCSGH